MAAHGADHPAVDGGHQVVAFGGGNKGAGQDQVALGGLDADQHLEVFAAGLAQADDGLRVQAEVLLLERFVQARYPLHLAEPARQPLVGVAVHVHAVAAALLGQVAGLVGCHQELGHRLAVARDLDHADGDAELEGALLPDEAEIADRLPQALGDQARLVGGAARQQHAELVAAQARQHVGIAHLGLQHARQQLQQQVAGGVAAGVVDDLELVEIHVQHGVHMAFVLGAVQRLGDAHFEFAPVDQAGEGVVGGVPRQLPGELALVAHVTEYHHHAQQRAVVGPDRRGRFLDRDVTPFARDQLIVGRRRYRLAQAQALQCHVLGDGFTGLVGQLQNGGDVLAARFVVAPAGQLLGGVVQVFGLAVRVDGDYTLADGAQRHRRHLALARGGLLVELALGDVPDDAQGTGGRSVGVAQHVGLGGQPVLAAVIPHHAVLDLVAGAFIHSFLHGMRQGVTVVHMDVAEKVAKRLRQLARRQTEQALAAALPVDGAARHRAVVDEGVPDRHARRVQRHP